MVILTRRKPSLSGTVEISVGKPRVRDSESPLRLHLESQLESTPRGTFLLAIDRVPPWYAGNEHIRSGYRPVTKSIQRCLESLGYLHNETVNIYTHLLPCLVAVCSNLFVAQYFETHYAAATWTDRCFFHVYLTTCVLCFGVSSAYHTLLCHSKAYHDLWVRLDYTTIVLQILGSFLSGIYVGFYCEPRLQWLYWLMICSLATITALVVVDTRFQSPEWMPLRLGSFIATGLSAFVPIIHAACIFPYEQLDKQAGLRFYYLEGVVYLIGAIFFAKKFPESWRPGKFDIWGASHQIFHILVVVGSVIHLYGVLQAFHWNYHSPRCPVRRYP